jgi:hypothetical protein
VEFGEGDGGALADGAALGAGDEPGPGDALGGLSASAGAAKTMLPKAEISSARMCGVNNFSWRIGRKINFTL